MRRFTSIVLCVILAIFLVLNVAAERGYFHYQSHGMKYEQTTQDEETFVRRINKEGACQDLPPDMAGICVEDCSGDSDCEGNFKCCSNGCGKQCQKPVAEKQCSIACNKMYDPVCGTDGVTYGNECTLRYLKCTRNQDFIQQKNEGECPHHRRGRGVFAETDFEQGEFLVEYAGQLISAEEGDKREETQASVYRYFFTARNKKYCIDATAEPQSGKRLGRLVNHGEKNEVNAKMRVIMNGNTPALCLFSIEPIVTGSEILYDYGVDDLPWKSNQVKPYIPNITVTCSSKTGTTQVIAPSSDVHMSDITTISATSTDHNLPCLPISVVSGETTASSSDEHMSDITTISATSTDHNLPCLPISVVSGETTASSSDVHTSDITTISATSTDHNLPCLPISVVSGETTASSSFKPAAKTTSIPCDLCKVRPPFDARRSCLNCSLSYCKKCYMRYHPWGTSMAQHKCAKKIMNFKLKDVPIPTSYVTSEKQEKRSEDQIQVRVYVEENSVRVERCEDTLDTCRFTPSVDRHLLSEEEMFSDRDESSDVIEPSLWSEDDSQSSEISVSEHDFPGRADTPSEIEPGIVSSDEASESAEDNLVCSAPIGNNKRKHAFQGQKGANKRRKRSNGKKPMAQKTTTAWIVSSASTSKSGERVWDKRHYCIFCRNPYKKITEHWEDKHSEETEIKKILALEKKSKPRRDHIAELRKAGDYEHNRRVLAGCEKGELIVHKRPKYGEKHQIKQYMFCSDCRGLYKKTALYRHKKMCPRHKPNKKRTRHLRAGAALMPVSENVTRHLKGVLDGMEHDQISLIARNDNLILKLGEHYAAAAGHTNNSNHYVSQKMREAARLLNTARTLDDNICIAKDLVNPRNFDTVVEATLKCSNFDDSTFEFSTPSLARKHGHILNRMAEIIDAEALKTGVSDNSGAGFKRLMQLEWPTRVSGHALRQAANSKWNEPKRLPLTKDIMRLHQHMCKEEREIKGQIKQYGISGETFSQLAKLTLAQLIVYNRRRPGETQFLKVETYRKKKSRGMDANSDVVESLSLSERLSIERLSVVYIRGKRDRGVPLLLTPSVRESVDLLVGSREEVGINPENPYVFARTSADSLGPHRGYDCLRLQAHKCEAEHPETITSTRLRKHVATMSQLLNLKRHELEQLANHLGHDVSVHREYYRLPHEALILGKVGKLLDALEQGKLHKFKGKTLDEVVLDDEVPLTDGVLCDKAGLTDEVVLDDEVPLTDGVLCDKAGLTDEVVLDDMVQLPNAVVLDDEAAKKMKCEIHIALGSKKTVAPDLKCKNSKRTCTKTAWTAEELSAVTNHPGLRQSFLLGKPPKHNTCKDAKEAYKALAGRTISQIKSKVWNLIQAERKKADKENAGVYL